MTAMKKRHFYILFPAVLFLLGMFFLGWIWKTECENTAYGTLSAFCRELSGQQTTEGQILVALKKSQNRDIGEEKEEFLERYGYRREDFAGFDSRAFFCVSAFSVVVLAVWGWSAWRMEGMNQNRIKELTAALAEMNAGGGRMVWQTREDEFSLLQDEMEKTVTALYETREEAVKAKEGYARHLTDIAHQLKTPVTAALLSLELMEDQTPNDYIWRVRRQLRRLNQLEESLLTLSKIEAGVLQLKKESVDVYTALTLAAENLEELFRRKQVGIQISNQGAAVITGDLEWTMEALMNLMKNSLEQSEGGQAVFCDYVVNALEVRIRIWDQGPGFALEDLPYLFDRFYRGSRGKKGGNGIGLALAHALLQLEGGELKAFNLPEGGACFEIRFRSHPAVT